MLIIIKLFVNIYEGLRVVVWNITICVMNVETLHRNIVTLLHTMQLTLL